MGYKFQFVTLAGFHALNYDVRAGARLPRPGHAGLLAAAAAEFELERDHGYRAVKHQSFVGAGYFDDITRIVMGADTSVGAMKGSTEEAQFEEETPDFLEAEVHHLDKAGIKRVPPPQSLVRE